MNAAIPMALLAGSPGIGEIIVIFLVILVLFGPRRLPEIARMIGKTMHELRRASEDFKDQIMAIDVDDEDDADIPVDNQVYDEDSVPVYNEPGEGYNAEIMGVADSDAHPASEVAEDSAADVVEHRDESADGEKPRPDEAASDRVIDQSEDTAKQPGHESGARVS